MINARPNKGINLASRPVRRAGWLIALGWTCVLLALAASAAHVVAWRLGDRELAELRQELQRLEEREAALDRQLDQSRQNISTPSSSRILRQLLAVEKSGASSSISPPEILAELAAILPAEAKALTVRLKTAPPDPELTMEAVADTAEAAEALMANLVRSPLVTEAEILEELHQKDGSISLRVLAELDARAGRR